MTTTYRERVMRHHDDAQLRRIREEYEDYMKAGRHEEARRVLAAHDRQLARMRAARSDHESKREETRPCPST